MTTGECSLFRGRLSLPDSKQMKGKKMKYPSVLFGLFLVQTGLSGAEYFVATSGNDANDGSERSPFRTIAKGIQQIQNGDTLTIEPGRYFESIDVTKKPKNVTIRARFPGSVFLHGDKPAPTFRPLPGYRFVYEADWQENVTAVNEHDSFTVYLPEVTVRDLEFNFGKWVKKDGKLYVSTTDGQAPDRHRLTVSVVPRCGLRIWGAEELLVDGLVFTGFYSHFTQDTWSGVTGLQLHGPSSRCVIRNCRAYFNSNGISLAGATSNTVVENCMVYANGSLNPSSGGNLIGFGGDPKKFYNNTFRNCISMYRLNPNGGLNIGTRFYSNFENCNIINCISIGEYGFNLKGSVLHSAIKNCYSEYAIASHEAENNIFGSTGPTVNGYNPKDISPLRDIKKADRAKYFADPDNHDYRPIADVRIGLPEHIEKGDTILLPPGKYPELKISQDNVCIKLRGSVFGAEANGAEITGNNVRLEGITFTAPVHISGDNAAIRSCEFRKAFTATGKAMALTHCKFSERPDLAKATGFRHSNIGTEKNELDNGTSLDGYPLGPCSWIKEDSPIRLTGPFIRYVGDTSADIEWWTSGTDVSSELQWGTTPECGKTAGQNFSGGNWHSISLTGLKPGTRYYFRIQSRTPLREHHANMALAVENRLARRSVISSSVLSFLTKKTRTAPRTLVVNGGDISSILDQARPGDTIQIKGGVYSEKLYVRTSHITLRNVPGEKVWMDGKKIMPCGIQLENKPGTVIDGLFFRNFTETASIVINGGHDITVQRCFHDGRCKTYTPGLVKANMTRNLTVSNCFIARGFYGSLFFRCPGLRLVNNVWFNNSISHFYVHNTPLEPVEFTGNIVFDNIPTKTRNTIINTWNIESLKESSNCYYFRVPRKYRIAFGYTRIEGDLVSARATYSDFLKESGLPETSIFVNPEVKALPKLLTYKHPEKLRTGDLMKEGHNYDKESLELGKLYDEVELQWKRDHYEEWDFSDWFASNPKCLERNIGLNPALFTNGAAN